MIHPDPDRRQASDSRPVRRQDGSDAAEMYTYAVLSASESNETESIK